MSRQILSIDIRNRLIAAVMLDTGLKANTVTDCRQVAYDPDGAEDDNFEAALAKLVEGISFENVGVTFALPAHDAIYRTLNMPFKDDSKIKQVLPFELEPNLPLPVEDLIIGFQKEILAEQAEVLTTAVERRLFDNYLSLFSHHGLQPMLVVPGSFATVLALIAHVPQLPEQTLVVDVDNERVTLYALSKGRICLVRSLPACIETETETEHLALKIRQTLTGFADEKSIDFSPSDVFLHGPGLNDPAAEARLADALNLPTHAMALQKRLTKIEIADNINYNSWLYDNALALACIEADGKECPNFHRSRSTIRNFWASYSQYIKTPAVLLGAIIIFGLGGVLFESHLLKKRVNSIKSQMEQVFKSTFPGATIVPKVSLFDQMKSKLTAAKKSDASPIESGNRIRSIDALLEISQRVPDSIKVVINRMVVSENAITISGETDGFNAVDDIKGRVEKSELFKKVTIASANMDKSGKNVRFKLKIDL